MGAEHDWLRHTVATLAYRGGKVVQNAPRDFADTRACDSCRSAIQVLAHVGDLLDWALALSKGREKWHDTETGTWDHHVERFFEGLRLLDEYLASGQPVHVTPEKLFQGPIADALWHVGQLATLRRIAGAPVRGENYYRAEIVVGRVGSAQSTVRREFD
jgi:hypothetical protein